MPRAIAPNDDIEACGLTFGELQELWLGCGHNGSLFSGEDELHDAWVRGRDVVMRLWGSGGRRPQIWWYYEAPALGLKYPGHAREQSYLFEAGVLSEAECAELLRCWRREFDRDHRPAHLNWADVPHSLREQWLAERPRRVRHRAPAPSEGAALMGDAATGSAK
jgi:hypothetical protein